MSMDGEKLVNHQKKDLTSSDKSDIIWAKLKTKASNMGFGTLNCVMRICDGQVVEVRYRPSEIEECLRA
jgi:hypothetical protein